MTTRRVRFALEHYVNDAGLVTVGGAIEVRPSARRTDDGVIVLPESFHVFLRQGEPAPIRDMDVDDGATWAWQVLERVPSGLGDWVTFTLTDVDEASDPEHEWDVSLADVTLLDPASLEPLPSAPTVAEALAAEAQAREDADTALAEGLAGKADLEDGTVPDGQLPERLGEASLAATFGMAQANSIVTFGDSIVAQDGSGPATTLTAPGFPVNSRGLFSWANAYLGQRLKLVRNAGVGGNTTAQMLARVQADVLAYPSTWVLVCGGANDVANGVSAATTIANLTAILDALQARGRRALLTTVPPSASYNTSDKLAALHEANTWIRNLPTTRAGVIVADVWRATVDPATGFPATGNVIDAAHPSDAGASRMGKAVADALLTAVAPRPAPLVTATDPTGIIANPDFGASGTGWTTVGAVTPTYEGHPSRAGYQASLVIADNTVGDIRGVQYEENTSGGRWVVGDTIQASAVIEWSSAVALTGSGGKKWWPGLRVALRNTGGDFAFFGYGLNCSSAETVDLVETPAESGLVTLLTPRMLIPSGVNRIYVLAGFAGLASGIVKVRDVSAWKAT